MNLNYNNIELIEFDLTTLCNAKCPLCYRNSIKYNSNYIKPFFRQKDEIIKQIEMFPNIKTIYLIGQMSEPTTHPEFLDIVKYIKSKSLKIRICTNGDLYTNAYWEQLGYLLDENDEVIFTICGSTQEIHSHYRVNTCLKNILDHAAALRKIRQIDIAKCIYFKYNEENLNSKEFQAIINQFSKIEYTHTNYPVDITYYKKTFAYTDFFPISAILTKYRQINKMSDFYKLRDNNIKCQSLDENNIQIDAFGNIYPCYVFMENNNQYIWDKNYNEILSGKYDCCKYCQQKILEYCEKINIHSIM